MPFTDLRIFAGEFDCPRLTRQLVQIQIPRELKAKHRRWASLGIDDLLREIEAEGVQIRMPPDQATRWTQIVDFSRYSINWRDEDFESKEDFGEYVRDKRAMLVNLRSKSFGPRQRDREARLRWTLLHEFGHHWVGQNLYPSKETVGKSAYSSIFTQETYHIPEDAIEDLTEKFGRITDPKLRFETFNVIATSHLRSILEEILIEKSINWASIRDERLPIGRVAYMASALRICIYSLSNLLEILSRLQERGLATKSELRAWERKFQSAIAPMAKAIVGVIRYIEKNETIVLYGGDRAFPARVSDYLRAERQSQIDSLTLGTEIHSKVARAFRIDSIKIIEDFAED